MFTTRRAASGFQGVDSRRGFDGLIVVSRLNGFILRRGAPWRGFRGLIVESRFNGFISRRGTPRRYGR